MEINCHACIDGIDSSGNTCSLCGGSGVIELTAEVFKEVKETDIKFFMRQVWLKLIDDLEDTQDKVDDVLDKCDDILEKLDE